MKIWKIILGIILIYILSHCSHKNSYGQEWYSYYYNGYGKMVQFSKRMTRINGNSFLFGELVNHGCIYSVWSYINIGENNYLIIYKFRENGQILYYNVYNYRRPIDWLYQYNDSEVRYEVFRTCPILDGPPFYFSLLTQQRMTEYSLDMSLDMFLSNDTIANDFLRNLRNDIIKYNLIEFSIPK